MAVELRRPRLAAVISIVMFLAGLISMSRLPIEQYPDIAPPQVSISATYTNSNHT